MLLPAQPPPAPSHPVEAPIDTSFVIKKKGLLAATAKHGNEVGEGHGYLKNPMWWTGMVMMIVGEVSRASCGHIQGLQLTADSQLCGIVRRLLVTRLN